jgi:hypothetical protein
MKFIRLFKSRILQENFLTGGNVDRPHFSFCDSTNEFGLDSDVEDNIPGGGDEPGGGDTPTPEDPSTGDEPTPEDPSTGGDTPTPEDPSTGGDEPGGDTPTDDPED